MRLCDYLSLQRKVLAPLIVLVSLFFSPCGCGAGAAAAATDNSLQPNEYRISTVPYPSNPSPVATSISPPAPAPPPPHAIQEVFVPLQKWKEQKLQDIESRVKRDEQVLKNNRISITEKVDYSGRVLSRRQILFKHLFARTCFVLDDSSEVNQTVFTAPLPLLMGPVVTPTVVVMMSPKVSVVESSSDVPVVSNNELASDAKKDVEQFSQIGSLQPMPSVVAETPLATEHSPHNSLSSNLASSVDGTPTPHESASINVVIESPQIDSPTLSTPNPDENDEIPTPLLKKIEKKVRSIRDSVSTAVNLSQNAAKVRSLRDSVTTAVNLSLHNTQECGNQSNKTAGNQASASPEITNPSSSPDMDFVTDALKKGRKTGGDLADAAMAPVKVKRKSFNFASEGAGAQILAASANTVGAKNIITENDDKYMLVPCAGEGVGGSRWVDIELSEYAFLTTVQTANFEHYSSTARKFAVLGAEHYPPRQWNVLGVFDFKDSRTVQTFDINVVAGRKVTRFLRVIYVGRHGNEYYCPISIFRAFGKNLIADLKDGLEAPATEQSPLKTPNAVPKEGDMEGTKIEGPAAVQDDSEGNDETNEGNKENEGKRENMDNPTLLSNGDAADPKSINGDATEVKKTGTGETSSAKLDEAKKATKELSSDDQILLNVVREETLSPVSGDDNIFRRVARMIRLLELNQSLTNQYIDTHLARFAVALSATRAEAVRGQEAAGVAQARAANVATQLDRALTDMRAATFRRDIVMCALMVCIGFLFGTHWVMWTALSGVRAAGTVEEITSPVSSPEGSAVTGKEEVMATTKSHIVETVSVDGVHVQMTDVRSRRRRKRRGDSSSNAGAGLNSPQQMRSGAGGRAGLPPIGVSPSKTKPLFTSNSFQPLCAVSDGERDKFTPRNG